MRGGETLKYDGILAKGPPRDTETKKAGNSGTSDGVEVMEKKDEREKAEETK